MVPYHPELRRLKVPFPGLARMNNPEQFPVGGRPVLLCCRESFTFERDGLEPFTLVLHEHCSDRYLGYVWYHEIGT